MIPYTLQVALLVAFCYFLYKILLEQESFYQLNRWLLIGCLLLAFLTPLLEVHPDWDWEISFENNRRDLVDEMEWAELAALSEEIEGQEELAQEPFLYEMESLEELEAEEEAMPFLAEEPVETSPVIDQVKSVISSKQLLMYFYLTGLFFFALKWLLQVCSLLSQIIKNPTVREGRYRMIYLNNDIAPCSFLNYIFINPSRYDAETFHQILEHEKIHAQQGHSFDMMVAELLVVVQWFNPAAWLYRETVINNLEFLTDNTMLSKGTDRQSYQLSLLRVATPNYTSFLVSNYNKSILRKRISMMNSHSSSIIAGWRYIAVAFMILGSVLALDAVKKALTHDEWEEIANEEMMEMMEMMAALEDTGHSYLSSDQIAELIEQGGNEGALRMLHILQETGYEGFTPDQIIHMSMQGVEEELRTILWAINEAGYQGFTPEQILHMCMEGADEELRTILWAINETGYRDFTPEQIMHMSMQGVEEELRTILWAIHETGFRNFTPEQIMNMSMQEVDEELKTILWAIHETGFRNFTPDQIMNMSVQQVEEELRTILWAMQETGFRDFTPDQIMNMSVQQVDEAFEKIVRSLQETGFRDFTSEQIMEMSVQELDDELENIVRRLHETNYRSFSSDQIMILARNDRDEELEKLVDILRVTGNDALSTEQIMQLSEMMQNW